ncbi:Methyltransferase domain-containing protein [Prosthecobacter debontii]|uniref:Methyltransferase domain-containing protein n=1 Tax=Prosthecobacter debontii TaxID=48467 RepID=A0A1T4XUL1_9BACT|nr:class I SAM-dependent methyltransferase [Prosthecobacter debontii]SKA93262.1 Methyltransferase domain-containing protein [Prosthecobacter debontii]
MVTSPSPSPESRFSSRVENYIRYRPSYPPQVIQLLLSEASLDRSSRVADIGSGTGIFTQMLLAAGCTVFGVEPNADMRAAAERLLGRNPRFISIGAPAQATTLEDHTVDLITAAQAFHWFDTPETRQEFPRILSPQGHIALIWNKRELDTTPFLRAYEQLLLTYGTDYARVRHENIDDARLAQFFPEGYSTHEFANAQIFDFDGLRGRLLSSSYAPEAGHPHYPAMLTALRELFDTHQANGTVTFAYTTRVYLGS